MWIDIHTHLNMLKLSPEKALDEAKKFGVEKVITIATEPNDIEWVVKSAQSFPDQVCCAVGIHPHEARLYNEKVEDLILTYLHEPFCVALGEIGLDFYYDHSPRNCQKEVFDRQMILAKNAKNPVQIHSRDAEVETLDVLERYKGDVLGVVHCFTGSLDFARKSLDFGYDISFSGIVTFKNAHDLRKVLSYVPLDRLHIETDAPFLTPMPHRGQSNQPAYLFHTGLFVAEYLKLSPDVLQQRLLKNAQSLFFGAGAD